MSKRKVLLFRDPQSVDGKQLSHDLSLLPAWRREKAMEYRFRIDRVLCTEAYLLLKRGLSQEYGIEGDPAFSYGENDKPFLRDYPDIFFNLSHCRSGILCVIGDQEVGCDIEEIPASVEEALCDRCFHETEKQRIRAAADPLAEFTKLWTMKEAYLKYTGEGISDDLPDIFLRADLSRIEFETHEEIPGVVYTICRERAGNGSRLCDRF